MKKQFLQLLTAAALLFVSSCTCNSPVPDDIRVIPQPQSVELLNGIFCVAGAQVNCQPGMDEVAANRVEKFANDLSVATGKKSKFNQSQSTKGISFSIDPALGTETYQIDIDKRHVKVVAGDAHGILYSIQTLSQMLPAELFSGQPAPDADWVLRAASIKDSPRFGYRGMHLDICRHFFPVEEVKKYLDVLALHKMNVMHWHLSDDQGWRIEIKKHPKLAEQGSIRKGTMIARDWSSNDGIEYGGYYTQDEIRDVVAYAESIGITIIPEIDLPGHMMGALNVYPELGCTGGPYEVWHQWGVSEQVLCPGKEETFAFIEDVLTEVMELFPSEYIHIGGDECPKTEWEKCPDCQKKIKELGIKADANHSAETRLQNYVTARVQKFVNDHGKKIIGWDEILEGDLAEGATVMSWRGVEGGIEAATKGFDVIMVPTSHFYFDYYQSDRKDLEPLSIGGYVPFEKVYSFEPLNGIPESAQKHILGVQANIWTEYVRTPEHLEYMVLPRMDALSEVQWCQPDNKDIERVKKSLEHMGRIYDNAGYTWCKAVFGEYGLPGMPGGTN